MTAEPKPRAGKPCMPDIPPCVKQGAILGGVTNPDSRHCGRMRSYRKEEAPVFQLRSVLVANGER